MTVKPTKLTRSSSTLSGVLQRISQEVLTGLLAGSLCQVVGNRLVKLGCLDSLHALLGLKTTSEEERIARSILIRSCYKAEQTSALGSLAVLLELAGADKGDVSQYDKASFLEFSRQGNFDDYGSHIAEAIELGGGQAVISLKETNGSSFTLVNDSIDIPVTGVAEFGADIQLSDCRLAVYDGVIEKVSEINFLLESSIATDCPLVIYARGYGYEVVSTLLHNWRNRKLRVIPLTPSSDPQNFWFADLPHVACTDPSEASLQKWENLYGLYSLRISGGFASIQDASASARASARRLYINREGNEIHASRSIVEDRANRLSSRKIEISIGRDAGNAIGITKDRVGALIRLHMHCRGDSLVTRRFAGTSVLLPARSDIVGQQAASSLVREMQTRSLVVQDV